MSNWGTDTIQFLCKQGVAISKKVTNLGITALHSEGLPNAKSKPTSQHTHSVSFQHCHDTHHPKPAIRLLARSSGYVCHLERCIIVVLVFF